MPAYKRVRSVHMTAGQSEQAAVLIRDLNQLASLRRETVSRTLMNLLRDVLPTKIAEQRAFVKRKTDVA